jgi:hypothetical protein
MPRIKRIRPPEVLTISNVVVSQVTETSFRVTWSTSEPTQGWLEWGTTNGGPYPNETTHETSFNYATHSQVVSGLTAGTNYYVKPVAVNAGATTVRGAQVTVTTTAAAGRSYPSWATDLQAAMVPPALSTAIVLSPGTYTGAQFNTWLSGTVGSGSSGTWQNAIARNCVINITADGSGANFNAKQYIQLDLTGTVIHNYQSSDNSESSAFTFKGGSHHIRVVNGTVDGHNSTVAVLGNSNVAGHQCGFTAKGASHHLEFTGTRFERIRGFGFFLTTLDSGGSPSNGYGWVENVWVHDVYIEGAEQGWAFIGARYVLGQNIYFEDIAGTIYDWESEYTGNGFRYGLFEDNTVNRYGYECTLTNGAGGGPNLECRYINANSNNTDISTGASLLGASGVSYRDITIRDDHIIAGHWNNRGGLLARMNKYNPKSDWVLERIISDDDSSLSTITAFNAMAGLDIIDCKQVKSGGGAIYAHSSDGTNVPDTDVNESGSITT